MPGTLSIYTIFFNPEDFPGLYVLREFKVEAGVPVPAAIAHTRNSIEEIRALIAPGLDRLPRSPDDHPSVIESWL